MSAGAPVEYVDATLRDLAPLPWGAAVGTDEIAAAAADLAGVGASMLEVLDPRCARAAIVSRAESPWDRLRAIVREVGSTPVGIVAGARNLWGAGAVAPDVVRKFVICSAEGGVTRIRLVDPLNDPDAMLAAARAAEEAGVAFVPTLVVGPAPGVDDPRWGAEARALSELPGARGICVSDGAGHLAPAALAALLRAVRDACPLPIEVQVQAPGGMAPTLATAAVEAGADAVHASAGPAALVAARPSAETVRAALTGGDRLLACDWRGLDRAARTVGPMLPVDRLRQAAGAVFGPAVAVPPALEVGLVARLGRMGLSRSLRAVADEAAAVAIEAGALTLAYPMGGAILAQGARHVIDRRRYEEVEERIIQAVLGRSGRLRGPVDQALAQRARELDPGPPAEPPALPEIVKSAPEGASHEDLVLWAMFGSEAERVVARRRSLGADAESGGDAPGLVDRGMLEALVEVVEASDRAEVSVEISGARVTVRRADPGAGGAEPGVPSGPDGDSEGLLRIESPMVGTFYRAPSPEAAPFVEEGSEVEAGQVVCLVEAMKLFNEINVERAGTVKQIAVENGEAVEYGQLLFLIEQ